jgi:hypothetical protein
LDDLKLKLGNSEKENSNLKIKNNENLELINQLENKILAQNSTLDKNNLEKINLQNEV